MKDRTDGRATIPCREARKKITAMLAGDGRLDGLERAAAERHLQACAACAHEHRIAELTSMVLKHAGARDEVVPTEEFYKQLRARIARAPVPAHDAAAGDDSWAAILLLVSRQLLPAMATLLLVIIGATFFVSQEPAKQTVAVRPQERVLFNDIYDYPAPTQDDVLETLVAVEEKENGK